jgi:cytochrome c-type biogenesis protein CcmH
MKQLARFLMLSCVLAPSFLAAADNPDASTEKQRYEALGGKIMCTCSCGQMLLKCNHVGCTSSDRMTRELRALVSGSPLGPAGGSGAGIPADVAHSRTDDDVLNWFRKSWGVTAVVEPSSHGFELIAWILPPLALGLGLLLVIFLVRSWKLRTAPVAPADLNLNPELEAFRARAHQETEI